MSANAQVSFTTGNLDPNYCLTTYQKLFVDMIAQLTGTLPGNYSTFNYGDSTPAPADQDKPWIRTIAGFPDRVYVFNGKWLSKHPVPAGANSYRAIWVGTPTALVTFDGGDTNALGNYSGPMWSIDTAFAARFPVGVGTFPSGTGIAVTNIGGEEKHVLVRAEIPPHTHTVPAQAFNSTGGGPEDRALSAGPLTIESSDGTNVGKPIANLANPTVADGHLTIPPYYGVYFIQRTTRIYYAI